jgi:hypothetical protein
VMGLLLMGMLVDFIDSHSFDAGDLGLPPSESETRIR